jgi:hypothetical protein
MSYMVATNLLIEDDERTLLEKLQNSYIGMATDDAGSLEAHDFARLRTEILSNAQIRAQIPDVVRKYRDQSQFWQFIKHKFRHYAERREYIWAQFSPLMEFVEALDRSPGVQPISETLQAFDPDHVHAAWQKALDRRITDPEGAITAARMLLETVCKHILDSDSRTYPDDVDLPKLWGLTAEILNLAPHQHQEVVFKTILGNCQSVVNSLGAIRNKIGDAHGQGRKPIKPKPRHAELAVNLAGTMASFLISTWEERKLVNRPDH